MGATPIYQPTPATGGGGTGVLDPELAAIAGLVSLPDKLPYFTGSGTAALADYTPFARLFDACDTIAEAYDILALGTAAFQYVGTSGTRVPLLDAVDNIWSGTATFNGAVDVPALDINSGSLAVSAVYFKSNNLNRWVAGKWDTATDDFLLAGYNDSGTRVAVFTATRVDGAITFALPFGPTPNLHDNSLKLATTQYVMSEIASYPFTVASIPGLQGALDNKQNVDAALTALSNLNTTLGLVEQTGIDTFNKRLIGVTNASDIPTRSLADLRYAPITHTHTVAQVTGLQSFLDAKQTIEPTLTGLSLLIGSAGLLEQTAPDTFAIRDIGVANPTSILTRADGDLRYTGGTVHTHPISDIIGLQPALDGKQPIDATLNALALLDSSVGVIEQTAVDIFQKRAIGVGAGSSLLTRADGDFRYATVAHTHVMANITDLAGALTGKQAADPTLSGLATLDTALGLVEQTGTDVFAKRTIGVGTGNSIPTTGLADIRYATAATLATKQGLDVTLTGLTSLPGTPGVLEQTTTDTFVIRGIGTSPSTALLTVGDADSRYTSVSLDPTLVALAGLNSTAGLVEQTGPDTFTKRLIGVTNGSDIPTTALADGRYAPIGSVGSAQPFDATLSGLALLDTTSGMVEQNGATSFTKRALGTGADTSILTRADGDGRYVSSVSLANLQPLDTTLTGLAALPAGAGLVEQTTTDTFQIRLMGLGASTSVLTRADGDIRYALVVHTHLASDISDLVPLLSARQLADPTLSGLALLDSALGLVEQTGVDQFTKRIIGVTNASDIPTKGMIDGRYSLLGHIHPISEVSGLQAALDAKLSSDPTLVGLAAMPTTAGLVTQTTADTFTITGIGVSPTSFIPTTLQADGRYAAKIHIHAIADITSLQTTLNNKQPIDTTLTGLAVLPVGPGLVEQTTADVFQVRAIGTAAGTSVPTLADADLRYAAINHTQAISTVVNLQSTLDGKQPIDLTLSGLALLDSVSGLVEQTAPDTFAKRLIGRGASTSIPTIADTDFLYADAVHIHAIADITNLQTTLNNKQTLDNTLTGLSVLDTVSGLVEQTAPDVFQKRLIGISTGASIPTFADNELRYAAFVHTHAIADVSNLQAVLDSKLATDPTLVALAGLDTSLGLVEQWGPDQFRKHAIGVANPTDIPTRADGDLRWSAVLIPHTHIIADVTGLQTALDGKQPVDNTLTAFAAITSAANMLPYFTGVDTFSTTFLDPFARTLLDDASATAMRATLLLGTSATVDTGTSAAKIPLLNGLNTWSGASSWTAVQSYTASINMTINGAATPPLGIISSTANGSAPFIQVLGLRSDGNGFGSFAGGLVLGKSRTDADHASGNTIGRILFAGPQDFTIPNTLTASASITGYTSGAWTVGSTPTGLRFYVGATPRTPITNNVQWGDTLAIEIPSTGIVNFPLSPTVPTLAAGDSSTKVATTAFVTGAVNTATSGLYQPLDSTLTALAGFDSDGVFGLVERTGTNTFAKRLIGVANATDVPTRGDGDLRWAALAGAAFIGAVTFASTAAFAVSPTYTGTPIASGDSSPKLATTAFVTAAIAGATTGGVPSGGTTNQILTKVSNTSYDMAWVNPSGLGTFLPLTGGTVTGPITLPGNPANPLEAAPKQYTDSGLALKANSASPTFTGTVVVPNITYPDGSGTTKAANTKYVFDAIATRQLSDATLTGLAAMPATLGLVTQTVADTFGITLIGVTNPSDIPTRALADLRYAPIIHPHTITDVTGLQGVLDAKQDEDNTLVALAALDGVAGLVEQTGVDAFTKRLIGVTNASDIPTRALADLRYAASTHIHAIADVTSLQTTLNAKQAADPTLDGLALLDTISGLVEQTGPTTFTKRLIGAANGTDILTRDAADGRYSAAAPLDPTLIALAGLSGSAGLVEQTGPDAFTKRLIGTTTTASVPTLFDTDGRYATIIHTHSTAQVIGLDTALGNLQPKENTLTGLAAMPATVGLVKQTATDVFGIVLTGTAAGTSIPTYADTEARYSVIGHIHTTAQVTGLDTALANKQPLDTTLNALAALTNATLGLLEQVTGTDQFQKRAIGIGAGTSIPTFSDTELRYAPIAHSHTIANVTGLQGVLDAKQDEDLTLTGLTALPATVGLVKQTAADTFGITLIGIANSTDIPTRADGDLRWGTLQAHTHPISDITGLQDDLDAKQDYDDTLATLALISSSSGVIEQTAPDSFVIRTIGVGLTTSLLTRDDGDTRFAAKVHTHTMSQITDSVSILAGKQTADLTLTGLAAMPATVGLVKQTSADVFGITLVGTGTGTGAGTTVPTFADTDIKYAPISHIHTTAQITNLDSTLANKQTADLGLTSLAALVYTAPALVSMTAGDTFAPRLIGTGANTSIPTWGDTEGRYLTTASIAGKQDADLTLTGLAALPATVGLVKQTAADVFGIVLTGTGAGTSIPTWADTEGRYSLLGHTHTMSQITDSVSILAGKQAADLGLTSLAALVYTASALVSMTAADTFAPRLIGTSAGSSIPTYADTEGRYSVIGHIHTTAQVTGLDTALGNLQPKDPTLSGLALLSATPGLVEQTATDTFAPRAMGLVNAGDILRRSDGDIRYAQLAVPVTFASTVNTVGNLSSDANIITDGGYVKIDRIGGAVDAYIYIDSDASFRRSIAFRTGTPTQELRWLMGVTLGAEPDDGTNTGANFALAAYTDTGSFINNVWAATRSTQIVTFLKPPTITNPQAYPDNSAQVATTAFVTSAMAAVTGGAYQPTDEYLTALSSPVGTPPANSIPYFLTATTATTTPIGAAGKALLGTADPAAARTYLGLKTAALQDTGTSLHTIPFLDGVNIWSAKQTLSTAASGSIALEAETTGSLGSIISVYRNAPTPAGPTYNMGEYRWYANNLTANARTNYLRIIGLLTDAADALGDSYFQFNGAINSASASAVFGCIGAGWQVGNGPTGGDMGVGTLNVKSGIFDNGININTKYASIAGEAFTGTITVAGSVAATGVVSSNSNIVSDGGYLMVNRATDGASAYLYLDSDDGLNSAIFFRNYTAPGPSVAAWVMGKWSVAGAQFRMYSYDDNGANGQLVYYIDRADRIIHFQATPVAPTVTYPDNSTQLATTAYVTAAIAGSGGGKFTFTVGGTAGQLTIPIGAYTWRVTAGTFPLNSSLSLTGSGILSNSVLIKKSPDIYPSIVYIDVNTTVSITVNGSVTGWTAILQEI